MDLSRQIPLNGRLFLPAVGVSVIVGLFVYIKSRKRTDVRKEEVLSLYDEIQLVKKEETLQTGCCSTTDKEGKGCCSSEPGITSKVVKIYFGTQTGNSQVSHKF